MSTLRGTVRFLQGLQSVGGEPGPSSARPARPLCSLLDPLLTANSLA